MREYIADVRPALRHDVVAVSNKRLGTTLQMWIVGIVRISRGRT